MSGTDANFHNVKIWERSWGITRCKRWCQLQANFHNVKIWKIVQMQIFTIFKRSHGESLDVKGGVSYRQIFTL